ncbi:MAG: hypothetical protein ACKVP3_11120 [Hyphomicrobiaceae bacterium]
MLRRIDRMAKRRGGPGCTVALGPAWREGQDGPARSAIAESCIPVTGEGFAAEGQRRLGVRG